MSELVFQVAYIPPYLLIALFVARRHYRRHGKLYADTFNDSQGALVFGLFWPITVPMAVGVRFFKFLCDLVEWRNP